jgi:effector-binding domain-containing protein
MGKMSRIQKLQQREQPTLIIRKTTAIADLPGLIGESYHKIVGYLDEIGELMSDVPFVAYHNMDMQNLDVEMGFPVSRPFPGNDEVKPGIIPEGKVIFCMYRGAYAGMEPLYGEMSKWMTDNGYEPEIPVYEYYYNDPEFPESEWLTKIVMPIK